MKRSLSLVFAAASIAVFAFSVGSCKKDSSNCNSSDTPGAQFTQVRSLISTNCGGSGCHLNGQSGGSKNFDSNCSIVDEKSSIQREINDGHMPPGSPLSAAEKAIINDWMAAGGRITD